MSETAKATNGRRSGDVDGVLRAFFRREMPEPWPAARLEAGAEAGPQTFLVPSQEMGAAKRRGVTLTRGRWALAASVLVLFAGYGFLSYTFPDASLVPSDHEAGRDVGTGPRRPVKATPAKSVDRGSPVTPGDSER